MGPYWKKDRSADSQSSILDQLIRKLFTAAADSMFVADSTGAFLAANGAGCTMSGYSQESLRQLNLSDLFTVGTVRERPLQYDDLPLEETVRYGCVLHERNGRSLPVDIEYSLLDNGRLLLTVYPSTDLPRLLSKHPYLHKVLNIIPDMVWLKDPDGVYLAGNPAFEQFIGRQAADVLGKTDYELFEPEMAEFFREHDRKAVLAGQPSINEEWVARAGDGRRVFLETIKTPLFDEMGQLLGVLGIARDITEREMSKMAVKKLAKFPNENPYPVMRVAQDGILLYANQASAGLLENWGCAIGQPLTNTWQQHVQQTLASGLNKEVETAVSERIFSLFIVPLVEDGYANIYGYDITWRKRVGEALQESQNILTIAESVAKIGSWKWDLNTQKVTWSAEMYNLFGVDRENFDGDVSQAINARIHPDDIEAVNQSNLSVLQHLRPLPLEYRIVLPDGRERTVWAEGRLTFDQSGKPTALVGYVQDITERKQVEQALRESEERYHSTLENMLEGCQIIAFDWRYLYLNASACRHGRRRKEELLGQTMMAAYPGIENTELFSVLRRCMADRTPHRMENQFQYDDGSFAWFDLSIQPVPEGLFILSIDITERKKAETALLEMAENMAAAQHITHHGSWEVRLTPELEIIDPQMWSDECYRIFGLEPGSVQITRDFFYARVHPEDREAAQQALWQAIHDGLETTYEYRLFRPDGSVRNIHDRVKAVLDEQNGRPVKVVGIVQDITESKQAEATIGLLHQRVDLILNSAGEGIYGTDVDGRITFVNPAMARMTGWESDELLGENAHAVFHHTRADGTPYPPDECSIQMAMLNDRSFHADDDTYWRKDGTPLSVEYTSTPIRQNGQIIGSVMVVKDITERKQAAQKQARLEEQLRQAQKMESIGRLAGGVAHDFNNQLTIIQLYGDLMRGGMAKDNPLLPKLEQIRQASNRANILTQQLLAFSRKQILQPVVLNLNDLVANLQKMLARLIGEDITLSTVLEPGLWPVMADPGQIEQVIMNLVVNARDAMPTGGILTIETGNLIIDEEITSAHLEMPPGPCVMLAVTDTGHGMDKTTLNQIFEPFFTTKEVGKGTGLGLATVHGIIKQSGGAIYVYSEPGQGATFKIYLPANESETAQLAGDNSTRLVQRGHETILLAEDEAALGELVRETLEEMGYTVLAASNGREALELAEQHPAPIDLLLADIVMPQMSGGELFQALNARQPDVKVLFMSGYTDNDVVRHGVFTAEVEFLSKPFTRSTLASKVRDLLDKT